MIGETDYSVRPPPPGREVPGLIPAASPKDQRNGRRSYGGKKRRKPQRPPEMPPPAPAPQGPTAQPHAGDDAADDEHSVDYLA